MINYCAVIVVVLAMLGAPLVADLWHAWHPIPSGNTDQAVAATSRLVASHRAEESERESSYFYDQDPLAKYLAGEEYMTRLSKESTVYGPPATDTLHPVALRTLSIDDRILQMRPSQVVVIGAGMDARPYRLDLPDTHWFEVDMPVVVETKETLLSSLDPSLTIRTVHSLQRISFNFDSELSHMFFLLEQCGYNSSASTLFLMEGVIMYLSINDVKKIFQSLPCSTGSKVIASVINYKDHFLLTNPLILWALAWAIPHFNSHEVAQLWHNDQLSLYLTSAFSPWKVQTNVNIGIEQMEKRGLYLTRFAEHMMIPNMKTTPENILELSPPGS